LKFHFIGDNIISYTLLSVLRKRKRKKTSF